MGGCKLRSVLIKWYRQVLLGFIIVPLPDIICCIFLEYLQNVIIRIDTIDDSMIKYSHNTWKRRMSYGCKQKRNKAR